MVARVLLRSAATRQLALPDALGAAIVGSGSGHAALDLVHERAQRFERVVDEVFRYHVQRLAVYLLATFLDATPALPATPTLPVTQYMALLCTHSKNLLGPDVPAKAAQAMATMLLAYVHRFVATHVEAAAGNASPAYTHHLHALSPLSHQTNHCRCLTHLDDVVSGAPRTVGVVPVGVQRAVDLMESYVELLRTYIVNRVPFSIEVCPW